MAANAAGLEAILNQGRIDPRVEDINYRAMELFAALVKAHLPPSIALKVAQEAAQRNAQAGVANAGAAAGAAPRPAGAPPQPAAPGPQAVPPGAAPGAQFGPAVQEFMRRNMDYGAPGSAARAAWENAYAAADRVDAPFRAQQKEREEKVRQEEIKLQQELRPPKRLAEIPAEITQAAQLTNQSLGQMNQYLDDSRMMSGRGAQIFPRNVAQYMNPYQQEVVNKIRDEGLRTLREGALPALEAQFVRRGAHGSTQHRELAERAARDIQSEILSRQAKAMHEGYGEAAKNFNSDQLRMLQHGQDISRLGGMKLAGNAADIASLMDIGRYKQGHAQHGKENEYIDYMNQINRPFELLERQGGFNKGFPTPVSQTEIRSYPAPYLGNTASQMGSLAGQLLGMSMRKRGGPTPYKSQIKRRRRR